MVATRLDESIPTAARVAAPDDMPTAARVAVPADAPTSVYLNHGTGRPGSTPSDAGRFSTPATTGPTTTGPTTTGPTTTGPTSPPTASATSTVKPTSQVTADPNQPTVDLLRSVGMDRFAHDWLPVISGTCGKFGPQTPYEHGSGMVDRVFCSVGKYQLTFTRFGTAAQARAFMECQRPEGTPSAIRPQKYPPTNNVLDLGICWTDGSGPLLGELSIQVQVSTGPATLTALREEWQRYA